MNQPFSRRAFLKGSALSLTSFSASSCALSSTWNTTEELEEVFLKFPIGAHLTAFTGFKIAFLTDIHAGLWLSESLLDSALAAIKRFSPHLLILGGDYVYLPDQRPRSFGNPSRSPRFTGLSTRSALFSIMEYLHTKLDSINKIIPFGAIGVLGNHDRWHHPQSVGWSFKRATSTLLANQVTTLFYKGARLTIVGVEDYLTGIPREPTLPKRKNEELRLLISHNPDYPVLLGQSYKLDYDLTLCGHTHGGQIKVPYFGAPIYNIEHREIAEGLHALSGSHVYTSRGLGVVELPFRVFCPPEVTLLELIASS